MLLSSGFFAIESAPCAGKNYIQDVDLQIDSGEKGNRRWRKGGRAEEDVALSISPENLVGEAKAKGKE